MEIELKSFSELSTKELYELLKLRSEVFVVEQNCVYLDIDGKDEQALHMIGSINGNIIAYARVFKAGDYFKEISIGRVVVKDTARKGGYGKIIMQETIGAIYKKLGTQPISLSAQVYLLNFYKDLGFMPEGEEYLEDGIPHIFMVKKSNIHDY